MTRRFARTPARSLTRRGVLSMSAAAGIASLAAACSNSDPLAEDGAGATVSTAGGSDSRTIVVGSQAYYSNEIIAELFAQILEYEGYTVDRQYQIGQREVYIKEIEGGNIDIFPEYSGALLQYYNAEAAVSSPQEIYEGLQNALPDGLRALQFAEATDQDSYVTTKEWSQTNKVTSLADLASVGSIKLIANSEIEARPYGPTGLKKTYGVEASVVPVEDSGGPLTIKALKDGQGQIADVYTASPAIETEQLVVLEDPKALFVAQNVTPIVTEKIDDKAASAIEAVTSQLNTEALLKLNTQSVNEGSASAEIAQAWLTEKGLVG